MKNKNRGAYPSPETALERDLDTVSGAVLEVELEEVKIRKKLPRIISTNGADKASSHFSPNGAEKESKHDNANGVHSGHQLYRFGNQTIDISKISYEDIITEDDEPVDNFPSEKQQRLLVNPLYDSSHLERPMIAAANVGIFHDPLGTPIVPDMFLSLGVSAPAGDEHWDKENRTYYVWKMGKSPEVAIEIVSNKKGGEGDEKFERYALLEVKYYVILDHHLATQNEVLTVYELVNGRYVARNDYDLPDVNLSLDFWQGTFEDADWPWIRWCDLDGNLIPLGKEDAEQAHAEVERERQEKIQAIERVETAEAEAERERQEKMQAIERAEIAKDEAEVKVKQIEAEAARQIERILEQARAAGITIDI